MEKILYKFRGQPAQLPVTLRRCTPAEAPQVYALQNEVRAAMPQPDNYAAFLGVPPEEWCHWGNADSAVVHPDFRGNGLQRAMLEAALPLLPAEITHLGATVCPDNPYSLRNARAGGFEIRARREMYGGFDRYLLVKEL